MNDKAHGFGRYTHMDGAEYDGEWFEGKEINKIMKIYYR